MQINFLSNNVKVTSEKFEEVVKPLAEFVADTSENERESIRGTDNLQVTHVKRYGKSANARKRGA